MIYGAAILYIVCLAAIGVSESNGLYAMWGIAIALTAGTAGAVNVRQFSGRAKGILAGVGALSWLCLFGSVFVFYNAHVLGVHLLAVFFLVAEIVTLIVIFRPLLEPMTDATAAQNDDTVDEESDNGDAPA